DKLEEDRADRVGGEQLQQNLGLATRHHTLAIDQDAELLEARHRLAVTWQPAVDPLVVGHGRRRHEGEALAAQPFDRRIDSAAAAGDVLNALAVILVQVFLDLALVVRRFVDRNADLAIRTGQRLGEQTGELAFDVEVADLPEIEQALIEV